MYQICQSDVLMLISATLFDLLSALKGSQGQLTLTVVVIYQSAPKCWTKLDLVLQQDNDPKHTSEVIKE